MWWLTLVIGLAAVVVGGMNLVRYFREGTSQDGDLAGSGPAHRLVAAAMFAAGGLFLTFFSLANLLAASAAGS
jgi:hypothetical protein